MQINYKEQIIMKIIRTMIVLVILGLTFMNLPIIKEEILLNKEALLNQETLSSSGSFNRLPWFLPVLFIITACLAALLLNWTDIPFLQRFPFGWYVTLPAAAWVCLVIIETLACGNIQMLLPKACAVNYLLILGLMLLPAALFHWSTLGARIVLVFLTFLSVINHYTIKFRGTLILPSDIFSIRTAANVAGNYQIVPDLALLEAMTACILTIVLLKKTEPTVHSAVPGKVRRPDTRSGLNKKERPFNHAVLKVTGAAAGVISLLPAVILSLNTVLAEEQGIFIMQYTQTERSHEIGFLLNLCENFRYFFIARPKGYSTAAAKALLTDAQNAADRSSESTASEKADRIFIIMNESMADLRMLGEFEADGEYLSNFYRIGREQGSKIGKCVVSVIGGGTSCTEFETLTGCTMQFLGSGNAPYQQYITYKTDSLASIASSLGYNALAVHSGDPKNWYRDTAYPLLGFDRFISDKSEDFLNSTFCRSQIDDQSLMNEIIRLDSQEPDPLFIFALTIQCHGSYQDGNYESTIHLTSPDESYPDVEQYLSLLRESDAAFGSLIESLSGSDKKTIVLMYGDHLPGLNDYFIDGLINQEEKTDEEKVLQMHETPFIFWSNYGVDFSDIPDELSANYLGTYTLKKAGIPLDPFHNFLYQLSKEYPVISRSSIKDAQGQFYYYTPDSPCYERLHSYEILQYYQLKNR